MNRSRLIVGLLVTSLASHAWAEPGPAKLDPRAPTALVIGGGTSPQDVFDRARIAAGEENVAGLLRLLAPDAQAELCLMMYVGTRMMIAMSEGQNAARELRAIMQKHGAREPDPSSPAPDFNDREARRAAARELFTGVDFPGFFEDLQKLAEKLGSTGGGMRLQKNSIGGQLTDLRIDGDHATGRVGDRVHAFVRVDGRWYVELDQ
jgi:hypothetical protein